MISYIGDIVKMRNTNVYCKFKQIIDKPKDVWVAPQMTQFFLLFVYLLTAHTIPYKHCNCMFSDNIQWNQHLWAFSEAYMYKLFFSNSYDRFLERKVLIICSKTFEWGLYCIHCCTRN